MYKSIWKYQIKRTKALSVADTGIGDQVTSPEEISTFLQAINLDSEEQEHLIVIILDTRNRIKSYTTVTIGLVDQAQAHAREIFRAAIINNATRIVLAHNHPSGDVTPSANDIRMTKGMRRAGKIIGIDVVDHIVIAGNNGFKSQELPGYFSFREAGLWVDLD